VLQPCIHRSSGQTSLMVIIINVWIIYVSGSMLYSWNVFKFFSGHILGSKPWPPIRPLPILIIPNSEPWRAKWWPCLPWCNDDLALGLLNSGTPKLSNLFIICGGCWRPNICAWVLDKCCGDCWAGSMPCCLRIGSIWGGMNALGRCRWFGTEFGTILTISPWICPLFSIRFFGPLLFVEKPVETIWPRFPPKGSGGGPPWGNWENGSSLWADICIWNSLRDDMFIWCACPSNELGGPPGGLCELYGAFGEGMASAGLYWGSLCGYEDVLCKGDGLGPRTGSLCCSCCWGDEDVLCNLESAKREEWCCGGHQSLLSCPCLASSTYWLGQGGDSNSGVQLAAAEPTSVIKYHIRTKKMGVQI